MNISVIRSQSVTNSVMPALTRGRYKKIWMIYRKAATLPPLIKLEVRYRIPATSFACCVTVSVIDVSWMSDLKVIVGFCINDGFCYSNHWKCADLNLRFKHHCWMMRLYSWTHYLSVKCTCKLVALYWVLMRRQLYTVTCPPHVMLHANVYSCLL